jgi:hypothetical protein
MYGCWGRIQIISRINLSHLLVTHFKEEHWIVNACLISTCELSLWKVLSAANFREEVIGPRDFLLLLVLLLLLLLLILQEAELEKLC